MNNLTPITEREIKAATIRVLRKGVVAMACMLFVFTVVMYVLADAGLADPVIAAVAVAMAAVVQFMLTWICVRAARRMSRAARIGK